MQAIISSFRRMAMQKVPSDLKEWFLACKRDLPWRRNPTPYSVWVSEIMLQQTQASVVKEYYERWMRRFPTIASLAEASLEEVIKMWEGLGYYSRARNLHETARHLAAHHAGALPSTREELSHLKGLGPYTIGAILSFAFHQKAPAVDGNVVRVISRYFAIEDDVQKRPTQDKIWRHAEEILPDEQPWIVAEALIELGATVCKKDPECGACPLQENCAAFQRNLQRELPKKGKKVEITQLVRSVYVIRCKDRVLVKKGEKGKVMADLYEFPYAETFPFAFAAAKLHDLPQVEHSFTRYRVTLHPSLWQAEEAPDVEGHQWISWRDIAKHPFSSGHRKILKEFHAYFTH